MALPASRVSGLWHCFAAQIQDCRAWLFKNMSQNVAKLNFWGVRGSTPSFDRSTWRYGGNTPCIELCTPDGGRFILDCGTGLRMLGNHWVANSDGKGIAAD